jgi:hypothetical protein
LICREITKPDVKLGLGPAFLEKQRAPAYIEQLPQMERPGLQDVAQKALAEAWQALRGRSACPVGSAELRPERRACAACGSMQFGLI